MTSKALAGLVGSILLFVVACAAGSTLLLGGGGAATCIPAMPSGAPSISVPPGGWPQVGRFDAEQVGHAATITAVGAQMGVPTRGWIIAVATAIQESQLRNLSGGAGDSIGLFQQRLSQGWGTPEQLRDPVYQAGKFYSRLLTIAGWENMALTDAAQAVQISAYPDAYAKHEPDATMLVNAVVSGGSLAIPVDLGHCLSSCSVASSETDARCADAATVFARAQSWLTAWSGGPVPYLSSGDPADWFGGYRRDCSGYVSMALGLDAPGLNTAGLEARSTEITKAELQPGDLLINTAPNLRGHVVLFERWTDSSMTRYQGYEQSGDGGTHYRSIPYPYFGGYPMVPYRFGSPVA